MFDIESACDPEVVAFMEDRALHSCKAAIETRDVPQLLRCLGLSPHTSRRLFAAAIEMLHQNPAKRTEQRQTILAQSLLFECIPDEKRGPVARTLIRLQDMFYVQRMLDLLEEGT